MPASRTHIRILRGIRVDTSIHQVAIILWCIVRAIPQATTARSVHTTLASRIHTIIHLVVRVDTFIRRGVATGGCRAVRKPPMALGAVTPPGITPANRIHTLTTRQGIILRVTTRQGITVQGTILLATTRRVTIHPGITVRVTTRQGITVQGTILLATTRRVTIHPGIIHRGCCVVVRVAENMCRRVSTTQRTVVQDIISGGVMPTRYWFTAATNK